MTVEREELHQIVEDLDDAGVLAVLAVAKEHARRPAGARPWPPAWVGSIKGEPGNLAARSEELLAEGFGR